MMGCMLGQLFSRGMVGCTLRHGAVDVRVSFFFFFFPEEVTCLFFVLLDSRRYYLVELIVTSALFYM